MPNIIKATRIGHSSLIQSATEDLAGELTRLRTVECVGRGWSSNVVHTVCSHKPEFASAEIVIEYSDGREPRYYIVDQLDFAKTFLPLLPTLPDAALWDLCRALIGSYSEGRTQGQNETRKAFEKGNLKLKKVRGRDEYMTVGV